MHNIRTSSFTVVLYHVLYLVDVLNLSYIYVDPHPQTIFFHMLYLRQRVLSWIAEILVSFLILFEAFYKTDSFMGLSGENLGGPKVTPNYRYCFSDWPLGILLRILKDIILQTTKGDFSYKDKKCGFSA
jgi:hypothetical protein